jgi:hypothetical protein
MLERLKRDSAPMALLLATDAAVGIFENFGFFIFWLCNGFYFEKTLTYPYLGPQWAD